MTRAPAVKKGGRASARPSAEAAPQDRLDRLERMIEGLAAAIQPAPIQNATEVLIRQQDEDEAEDKIDRAAELKARREREKIEDLAAAETINHLIDPRHKEIFDWLCRVQGGKRAAQMLKEILRSALIRERPAYREAHGGGGNSSRDVGALTERLPGRK